MNRFDIPTTTGQGVATPVNRFNIPNYQPPNLNTDLKISQAPSNTTGQVFTTGWLGAIDSFLNNIFKPIQNAVSRFRDPTGLDAKQSLQNNPIDTDSLINTSFKLAAKKNGGSNLTAEQSTTLKQGQGAFAKKANDLVMGFLGGGDFENSIPNKQELIDRFVNYLAKENRPDVIAKELKALGASDDVAARFGEHIATLKEPEQVRNALSQIEFLGVNMPGLGTGETQLPPTNELPINSGGPDLTSKYKASPEDIKLFQNLRDILPKFKNSEEFSHLYEIASKQGRIVEGDLGTSREVNLVNELVGKGTDSVNFEKLGNMVGHPFKDAADFYNQVNKNIIPIEEKIGGGEKLTQGADTLLNLPPEEKAVLKPVIDQNIKTVKDKVHLMDYFQTPEFVLKKLGLQNESNMLHDAFYNYRSQVKKEIAKIINWKNEVSDIPGSSIQIFKYLDGQTTGVELTDTERKVGDQMRSYLADWADKLKLPKANRIASYITHLFDEDLVKKEFDPDFAKIITDKVAGSVYDPFLEKRLGVMGYKEDVFGALDAYVKRATRKVNMDPALKALKDASSTVDLESEKYLARLTNRINLRPTETDNLVDNLFKSVFGYKFGNRPVARVTQTVRQMIYRGTLGLNFGAALRNLTQGANTYAKLGEKYTVIGYSKLFSRLATRNLEELFDKGILDDAIVQDRKVGVYKSLLQKIDPVLFKFFDMAEKINRGAAYFGAKSKAIAGGASEEESVNIARALVRETQFAFGNLDSPVIMSSDFAKTIFQLQTFNVKQTEFLKNMIKNKEFGGLLRYIGASLAMVYTIGRLFGMNPTDIIPSVRLGGSPLMSFFGGLADLTSSNTQTKSAAPKKIANSAATIAVPAWAQIKKTMQGIGAFNKGKDTTPTGRTRFNVEQTPGNLLRVGLFGKSSLPAAQEYYNNIGKKKTTTTKTVGNRFNQ